MIITSLLIWLFMKLLDGILLDFITVIFTIQNQHCTILVINLKYFLSKSLNSPCCLNVVLILRGKVTNLFTYFFIFTLAIASLLNTEKQYYVHSAKLFNMNIVFIIFTEIETYTRVLNWVLSTMAVDRLFNLH